MKDQILDLLSKTLQNNINRHKNVLFRETSKYEFKLSFNLSQLDVYSKTMVAFSNNCGGYIIFGISDAPRKLVGIDKNKFENVEQEKITTYLLDHFSPEINWEIGGVTILGLYVGYIYTHESTEKPIICKLSAGNEIKNGDIYYRYRAQKRRIEYGEIRKIIDGIKNKERREWMNLVGKIAKTGPDKSAILDLSAGKIEENAGTVLIDESLISKIKFLKQGSFKEGGSPTLKLVGTVKPVVVLNNKGKVGVIPSNDPNAVKAQIDEVDFFQFWPWDYAELNKQLHNRYSKFVINNKYHSIRKNLASNPEYAKVRLLDPKNPNTSKKTYYSKNILLEFDKHYSKKLKSY